MSGLAAADLARAAAFVALMNARPMPDLIAGLTTRMSLFELQGAAFPLTLNDRDEAGNCYICRPSAAYIDYALEEIRHFARQPVLQRSMAGLIRACRPLLTASGLDHQVQINNWLFSTNPVPGLGAAEAGVIRDRLCAAHPARALVIRSLNEVADGATMAALKGAGFQMLPARRIWLYDGRSPARSRDIKRDDALLRDGRFEVVTRLSRADYDAAAGLYGQLYLQKYTPLNPQYQGLFLSEMHRAGLLDLIALRAPGGDLVAVTGLFESGLTLTQPVVGYDTSRPEAEGLYRRMMALSRQRAEAGGRFFNMSAGAAGFKKNRRARPVIEYTAVYTGHLSGGARRATAVIAGVLTRLGIPLLQRFDL
ncbi:GNAT family N-acetyltransferase [Falsigemmobacter faecalis]|uniref:GNAT family N-acetyltransferase n=1 Tax=Falsigemmobacter faecalis TaxID=2488730 RepID=A0A3P3DIA1_9RHOB|nr:GNAT family N-acetyltransferase [Falsigemmobacter faecalis]RRH73554.1 GNAT family N-acetyltransferase [Falsigemmobacter faecalis]